MRIGHRDALARRRRSVGRSSLRRLPEQIHAMTGRRIGHAAGPLALISAINKLQSQMS
jgi:hypothetical protein